MKKGPLAEIKVQFKGDRADLIPVLQRIQAVYDYLPKEVTSRMSRAGSRFPKTKSTGWRPFMPNSGSRLAGSIISGSVWGLLAM